MKNNLSWKRLLVGGFLFALLTGCVQAASETPIQPTTTPVLPAATPVPPTATLIPPSETSEPTSCGEVKGNCIELTYTGESCTYEGPSVIQAGPLRILYFNESEGKALVGLVVHKGDESLQDMKDYLGEQPSTKSRPRWSRSLNISSVQAGETYSWEQKLLDTKVHTILCGEHDPHELWFGGGFRVED